MVRTGDPRYGHKWRQAQAWVYRTYSHCIRCGLPVDKSLPYRDPVSREVNLWSKSTDHYPVPIARGGPVFEHWNLRLAHLKCNIEAKDSPPPGERHAARRL